ncbi:MAG: Sialidase, partial [Pedosphaera sp.]|nr:Sialidase [Pedosphaera sp.]
MPTYFRFAPLVFALSVAALNAQQTPSFFETAAFVSGQGGYNTYRIPAIVRTTNGTLLAFCEGRKNSGGDSGDIDIVLRRSIDNGATWGPMMVVQEEGGSALITIGNPAPVVDEATGYIHLLFCRNNDRVFHTVSTNDGVSWSARDEITSSVKRSNWGWYATGPGHGIQLKRGAQAGRLVVPCDHVTTNNLHGAQAIYSDNHGVTWRLGAFTDGANGVNPNETTCEELVGAAPGGGARIYFNSRDQSGSASGTRSEARSNDGGTSFSGPFTNRAAFVCPVVQGSLLRLRATDEGGSENRLLFACPNNASSRVMLSVWSSTNEAVSWSAPKLIYSGPSAYSDMARTSAGDVALLYEKGNASPYETITLARFNEGWLESTATAAENPLPAFWNFEEKAAGQTASTNPEAILDVSPYALNNNLTAQKPFSYVGGSANYGAGAALAFDGTGGLQLSDAATANHFDFGPSNSFTIEAVFRIPSGSTQIGSLVAKDYGSVLPSWWLRVQNGQLRFLVSDDSVESSVTGGTLVNDGQWHHVAAVRDTGPSTTRLLRLYLDGVLLSNVVDATTGSLANSQPLNIGRFGASSSRNLTGDIDMVRITPQALTPAGFLGHYTQFDADGDRLPDNFERAAGGSLQMLGSGDADGDG